MTYRALAVLAGLWLVKTPVDAQLGTAGKACPPETHGRFDFWVGNWEVHNARGVLAGTNRIERILDGCVVLENWTGARGSNGKSFTMYDAYRQKWHQTWVDNSGLLLVLEGGFKGAALQLEGTTYGTDGRPRLNRVSWTPLTDGRVRQYWEISTDAGKTWSTSFDGYYRRSAATPNSNSNSN